MKIVEIHRNGINAHYSKYEFYLVDFDTRDIIGNGYESHTEALQECFDRGYQFHQIIHCY